MSDQIKYFLYIFHHMTALKNTVASGTYVALIFAAIIALYSPGATAAELVIISSSSNDFKVGQVIDSSADISLTSDATVTLISENGKVITINAPHSGPIQVENPADGDGSLIPSLKKMISGEKTEAGSLGVMRSVGGSDLPEDPWAIIAGKGGSYCVSSSKPVVLWRPNSLKTSKLSLLNTDNDKEVRTTWHAGQNILHWPRLLPLIDGATYRVDLSGESKLPKLSIQIVPDLPTSAHSAVWMAEHGCKKQAMRLINSMK